MLMISCVQSSTSVDSVGGSQREALNCYNGMEEVHENSTHGTMYCTLTIGTN